jgi:hypothetical protein
MNGPSTLSTGLFVAIVLAVAVFMVWAGTRRTTSDRNGPAARAAWPPLLAILIGGLLIPGVLAYAGLLDRYSAPPPPAMLTAVITIGTVVLAYSAFGTRVVTSVPLVAIVGFQAFRVPLEWLLHRLYVENVIPIEMTYAGRNFDVISGITAIALAAYLVKARHAPRLTLAWNILGLALLANIVIVAVLAMPTPFQVFTSGPPNTLPGTFPWVWLPAFLVQAALFGHLLVFRTLRRRP